MSKHECSEEISNAYGARPIEGWLPRTCELGPSGSPDWSWVAAAAGLIREGRVFDLDVGRWPNMRLGNQEPQFQVLAHRTPRGLKVSHPSPNFTGEDHHVSWVGDLIVGATHSGTHVDALSHITRGAGDATWFGEHSVDQGLGDFGPVNCDAAAIPPLVGKGVLFDIPKFLGVERLEAGYAVDRALLEAVAAAHQIDLSRTSTAYVRTGFLDREAGFDYRVTKRPGLTLDAAKLLVEAGVMAVGADTPGTEVMPWDSGDGEPMPVSRFLQIDSGVHTVKGVYLEELASAECYEFFAVCAAPRIRHASGSFARPIAII